MREPAPTDADVPAVPYLTARLADAPESFLGSVSVAAVLSDVLSDLGHDALPPDWAVALAPVEPQPDARSWRQACGLVAWLIADPVIGRHVPTGAVLDLLSGALHELAQHVGPTELIGDGDRREELCRLLLRAAGVTPAGETAAQAEDRLATLDTTHRLRVIAESRRAEAHTQEVRKALARKRAQEAAARATRE